MNDYYVYKITCPIRNELIYIGEGRNQRAFKHLVRKDKHPLTQRIQWIKNQGKKPIIEFIIEDISKEEAQWDEQYLITWYGRKDLGKGSLLNLTDGGDGGKNPSDETRKKMSESHQNKILSKNEIIRLQTLNIGRKASTKAKENMSKSQKQSFANGRVPSMLGKHHKEESKLKSSLSQKGKPRGKRIYDEDGTWKIIKVNV
jgi:group I intron endonuclease